MTKNKMQNLNIQRNTHIYNFYKDLETGFSNIVLNFCKSSSLELEI